MIFPSAQKEHLRRNTTNRRKARIPQKTTLDYVVVVFLRETKIRKNESQGGNNERVRDNQYRSKTRESWEKEEKTSKMIMMNSLVDKMVIRAKKAFARTRQKEVTKAKLGFLWPLLALFSHTLFLFLTLYFSLILSYTFFLVLLLFLWFISNFKIHLIINFCYSNQFRFV